MDYVKRIEKEIETAYVGVPVDYHMTLGKLMSRAIAVWVLPESTEDVVCEVRNVRRDVENLIMADIHRSRRVKP